MFHSDPVCKLYHIASDRIPLFSICGVNRYAVRPAEITIVEINLLAMFDQQPRLELLQIIQLVQLFSSPL